MQKKRIIAVIPCHNEEKHISKVILETKKYVDLVLVVDDASSDKTSDIAKQSSAIVLRHVINLKKGAALRTGCEAAIMLGANKIIVLDGDGQHDPKEIPKMISELDSSDIVIGGRKFNEKMPISSKLGNIFLSKFSKFLFKSKITDTQTGFRAFNSNIYPKIEWKSSGYEVETEIIRNISKHNLAVKEIEIDTIYHDNYKGTTPIDGMKIAFEMLKWRIKK